MGARIVSRYKNKAKVWHLSDILVSIHRLADILLYIFLFSAFCPERVREPNNYFPFTTKCQKYFAGVNFPWPL